MFRPKKKGKEGFYMTRMLSRILWILAGVLLIAAGVLCLVSPGTAISSLTVVLGTAMLFSGVVDIVIFASGRRYMIGAGWFLVDGVLTVLLSLFLLCNQWFTALTLPFIVGMWLLFSGISKFVNSFDLQRLGVRGWGWFTALGLLLAAAGFLSFLDPLAGMVAISALVGVFLILQGAASILRGCFSGRFWL